MGLNHFRARHFRAKHFRAIRGIYGAIVAAVTEYIIKFRRRRR